MSILHEIVARVRVRLAETKARTPLAIVRSGAEHAPRRASFRAAIVEEGTSLIAETKARSPSKGVLRDPYEPVDLARAYASAGARAISVLTEPEFFAGAPAHLMAVRDAVSLPILRKDFVVDEYQLWEAKAWGASAALLIVSVLDDALLRDLRETAQAIGLDALVEVHTEAEAERALEAGAAIVGVNHRDLTTFQTDQDATRRVARVVPPSVLLVSESGIQTRADVLAVEQAGARAVLVGEALVTATDPGAKARELLGLAAHAPDARAEA